MDQQDDDGWGAVEVPVAIDLVERQPVRAKSSRTGPAFRLRAWSQTRNADTAIFKPVQAGVLAKDCVVRQRSGDDLPGQRRTGASSMARCRPTTRQRHTSGPLDGVGRRRAGSPIRLAQGRYRPCGEPPPRPR